MRLLVSLPCTLLLCLAGCAAGGGSQTPDDGTSPDSGTEDTPFAREMISAHNSVRLSATPVPNPALAVLTWSSTAASKAQAWADGCKFEHNPNLSGFGENLAAATPNALTTAGVVQGWAGEASSYDYGRNLCAPGKVCGHYTQLVWRDTTQVGCATKVCSTGSPFPGFTQWQLWVCDYSPPGNFVGQRPY